MGSVLETSTPPDAPESAPLRVLVVATDARAPLREYCEGGTFAIDCIAHHEAIARIASSDFAEYAAVVIQVTDQPSSASAAFRTGEYVLHFLHQLRPEALSRVVVFSEVDDFAPRIPVAAVVPPRSAPEAVLVAIRDCTPAR
jgi:hypothetical protein